ncbi:HEAT repeat domain-containing protein [Streptomyces atratus]|uniref:HEAT repeat domain-containing protein n=1 Tax=Streptomyces atratus TaxID=1893 RepID=UPI0033E73D8A
MAVESASLRCSTGGPRDRRGTSKKACRKGRHSRPGSAQGGDSDELIRTATVGTLGSHGTRPMAVELLVRLLADPSKQVRAAALSPLGFLHHPGPLPAIRRLAGDDSPHVRARAAIAMSRFPTPDSGVDPSGAIVKSCGSPGNCTDRSLRFRSHG